MFWLRAGLFLIPVFGYGYIIYRTLPLPFHPFATAVIGAFGFVMGGLLVSTAYEAAKFWDSISDAYGSAEFVTVDQARRAGLTGRDGVILGRLQGKELRFSAPGHIMTLAPTRSGKGVSGVIPNLLDYAGSVVTVDIKGENVAIAGRRRRDFGPVYKFAPFDADSACFNPFDFLRDGKDAWEDAALLADMLIVPSGSGRSKFFEEEAKSLLTGLILHVAIAAPPEARNMATVRGFLMLSGAAFTELLAEMERSAHPIVRRTADSFGRKENKLQTSVLAEAQSQTLVWDSERLTAITTRSDFTLESLKEAPASVFLVIPPERLGVYRPFLRLMLGLIASAMTRNAQQPERPVLFLIDEFPQLGYMAPIEEGIAYLAGYGVRLWLFGQDYGQIEAIYPKVRSLIANCAVFQTFGVSDSETAKLVSEMLGQSTVRVRTRSAQSRRSMVVPDYYQYSVSSGETGRPLLTADEVRCLPEQTQILFIKGLRPILARKIRYFEERRWRRHWDTWR